jgi:predicted ATP-grasp superfamily ATP-dependent carboligase
MNRAVDALRLGIEHLGPLESPVMVIALRGWFDVSGAASSAVEHLVAGRTSVTVAEIDADPFFDFTQQRPMIHITDGLVSDIDWPTCQIAVSRGDGRDLVIVTGVEPHLHWRTWSDHLITVARRLDCEAVVTVGAAAEAVPHTRAPSVTGSTTNEELARRLGLSAPSYQGITGIVGVLQGSLDTAGIPAVSLRVGIPHYLMHTDHPQAVAALATHLAHVLGIGTAGVDTDDLEHWREIHDEVVDEDRQLMLYVQMLEQDHDRRAEAQIPSADDLGAQFEEFLRDQRSDDD